MTSQPLPTHSTSILNINDVPSPPEHWLKGSLGRFDPEQFHTFLYQNSLLLGSIYKIHLMKKPMVVLTDPQVIQKILKQRPDTYRRASQMERVFTEMGVQGVFSAEGEQWQRYRKLMNPAFRTSQIKQFYATLNDITQRLCHAVADAGECFNFQQLIQRYTVDTTSMLSFGYDLNTLENPNSALQQHLCKIFPMIAVRNKAPIAYWKYFKLKKDRELDESLVFVRAQVAVFIDAAREKLAQKQLEANNSDQPVVAENMLESMLISRDENGLGFSDHELFGNVITLLLAGEDTTANTLAWAIDYLADHEDLQDRLYQEINQQLPSVDGCAPPLSWEQLDACPLVLGVIQESMRLKPVAPYIFLEGCEDTVIAGYNIPKGVLLTLLLSANSYDESIFEDALSFKPERWAQMSEQTLKQVNRDLMPFGGGARLCPGRLLSLVEMKIALIELLRRFKFSRAKGYGPAVERLTFTLIPDQLMVTAHKR